MKIDVKPVAEPLRTVSDGILSKLIQAVNLVPADGWYQVAEFNTPSQAYWSKRKLIQHVEGVTAVVRTTCGVSRIFVRRLPVEEG